MRRLAVLISAIAVVQTIFFSALAPLLPSFEEDLGLSKAQAGVLVGLFPIGLSLAALPVGVLAARVGVKRFSLAGLLLIAFASAAFGLVDSYEALLATRLLQGVGAGLCWSSGLAWLVGAAPRERRGETIGLFFGAGAAGQIVGPAVGGLAVLVDRAAVFAGVAGIAVLLALVVARFPGPARGERQSLSVLRRAHGSRAVLGGLWLVVVAALLLGIVFVLAPLQLNRVGWGPVGIAGTFLIAAFFGVIARPLIGRWADRRGLIDALRILLVVAIPMTLVIHWVDSRWLLSVCVVWTVNVYGVLMGPATAFLSHAYERAEVVQVFGFALMGLTNGAGFFVGSAAGGEIAHVAGDATAYALAAAICLATFGALTFRRQLSPRPAVEPSVGLSSR